MPARGLILLTALSTAALAVLLGLGLWQLRRLQWKEGLIAEIEARVKAEPVSLKEAVARAHAGEDVSYLRVRAEGKFDNTKERYFFTVSDGTPGWHAQKGYMTAAVRAVIPFVFDSLELHRLEAACLPANVASIKLLERTGFTREGIARRYLKINGVWQDHLLYALLESDRRR